jgi:predicted amidohydrolase YtcJ
MATPATDFSDCANHKPKIENRKSKIENRKSKIENRKSNPTLHAAGEAAQRNALRAVFYVGAKAPTP